jgi:hypothetical protein
MSESQVRELTEEELEEINALPLIYMHGARYPRRDLAHLRKLREERKEQFQEVTDDDVCNMLDCVSFDHVPMLEKVGRTRPGYISVDALIAYYACLVDFKASLKSQGIDIYGENHPNED